MASLRRLLLAVSGLLDRIEAAILAPARPTVSSRRRRARRHQPPTYMADQAKHPSSPACPACGQRGCVDHCPTCGGDWHAGHHVDDCATILNLYTTKQGEVFDCYTCGDDVGDGGCYSFVDVGEERFAAVCLGCASRAELGIGFS